MRKINKIMMMTVAILLSLVLITSSVVSGTLAKYTTSSSASDSARVAKWGVTIKATENLPEGVATIRENVDGIDIKITNLKLGPGDEYPNAIQFEIDGEPEVALMLKITVKASFINEDLNNEASFVVDKAVSGLDKDVAIIPFGFTFGLLTDGKTPNSTDDTILAPGLQKTGVGEAIMDGINNKVKLDYCHSNSSPRYGYVKFYPTDAGNDIVLTSKDETTTANKFYFGFYWPKDYGGEGTSYSVETFDAISTWLAANKDPEFSLNYTISLEQINQ